MLNFKYKILFIHPSLVMGGAERMITYVANLLSYKFEVSILLLDKNERYFKLNESVNIVELNENVNASIRTKNLFQNIFHIRSIISHISEVCNNIKPDVVIGFDDRVTWLMWIVGRKNKLKTVYSQRNDPYDKSMIKNKLFRHIYKTADGVVFQLEEVRQFYNVEKTKCKIIPNPVLMEIKRYHWTGQKKIIAAGRFQYRKRFDLLIKAFSNVSSKYNDYRLYIYGDGEERKNLEELIESLGLKEKVFLPGIISNVMMQNTEAAFFVLSSDAEGIPNILIEAMTEGIPVIATDCTPGGARFLLNSGNNGILVERNSVNELENAMIRYIENEQLRRKCAESATEFLENLKPEIIGKLWESYIKEIVEGR